MNASLDTQSGFSLEAGTASALFFSVIVLRNTLSATNALFSCFVLPLSLVRAAAWAVVVDDRRFWKQHNQPCRLSSHVDGGGIFTRSDI
jgi:hypothetical protein